MNIESVFICVYDKEIPDVIIGFIMFQFSWDDENEPEFPVLYVYELQIVDTYRRKNIGRKLMEVCIQIARHWSMNKIVSKYNVLAILSNT